MRGDSRQDLYAKTVALLGLGLLAGAGALVDYWPTDLGVPRAASALLRPARAHALAIPQSPPDLAMTAMVRGASPRIADATPAASVEPADLVTSLDADVTPPPPVLAAFDVTPMPVASVLAPAVALSVPAAPASAEELAPRLEPAVRQVASGAGTDDSSFLGGALRTAGGSIVNAGGSIVSAGAKAGSTVAGAFRAAAGAVRKLKLF